MTHSTLTKKPTDGDLSSDKSQDIYHSQKQQASTLYHSIGIVHLQREKTAERTVKILMKQFVLI